VLSTTPWMRSVRVLWLGQFLVTASLTVVVPLLPFYLEELGCRDPDENHFWTAWALAAPAIPLVVMAPLWGRLGDRFGRKAMVVRALFGIAGAVLAMAFARSPLEFFLCRLAQGAFGGVDDAAAAFASTEVPPERRGRAIGLLQSGTAAGALVGPLAGGFLSSQWGFAPILLTTAALIALAGALAASVLGDGQRTLTRDRATTPTVGRALASLLEDRGARAFLIAGFFVQVGGYGLIAVFANRVRFIVPDSAMAAVWVGSLQSLTWAMTLAGAAWWGRRNDRVAVDRSFALAAAVCAVSVAAQAIPSHPAWLVPLRALQGFCNSALGQSVFLRVSQGAEPAERGLRIGIANSGLTLGHVTGALAIAVLGSWFPPGLLFSITGAAFLTAAVVVRYGARSTSRSSFHVRPVAS
jgi:MFS transporter, DHA1 family, staphyloferrin B biosynthesis exporter